LVSVVVLLCDVLLESIRAKWSVEPQGPRERSAALRQRQAFEVGVQMRTTSARCASRVREQRSGDRDDAQQL
jgi:hypothetical protein